MKRTPIKAGSTPLKRSSWLLTAGTRLRVRTKRLASRHPPTTAIRQSARDEACTLCFPCCNGDPATTVWCHSNRLEDGKGTGLKARDAEGCYGCSTCHAFLDGGYAAAGWTRAAVEQVFDHARAISRQILRAKGVLPDGR